MVYKILTQSDLIKLAEKISKKSKRKYAILKDMDDKKVCLVIVFDNAKGVLPLTRYINYQLMYSILNGIEKYVSCENSNGELESMLNIPEL